MRVSEIILFVGYPLLETGLKFRVQSSKVKAGGIGFRVAGYRLLAPGYLMLAAGYLLRLFQNLLLNIGNWKLLIELWIFNSLSNFHSPAPVFVLHTLHFALPSSVFRLRSLFSGLRSPVFGLFTSSFRLPSSVIGHRSLVIGHRSLVIGHWSSVFRHWSLVFRHWSLVFRHRSSVIGHWSSVIGHWSSVIGHWSSVFRLRSSIFALLFLFFATSLSAQTNPYLYQVNQYNFIRYDLNEMDHFGNDSYSSGFYDKLEKLMRTGEGKINVVQIGGSHIQAGTFSGQIRTRLQQMNGEMNAGWGFMFPYRISRTNSPYGYYIRYTGAWMGCRNVEKRKTCALGVGGISATTSSAKAELTILLEDENVLDYSFNKIRVFYENADLNYTVSVDSSILKSVVKTDEYYDFELNAHVDSLKLTVQKGENSRGSFTLFGMSTESAPNGITYHSIGINGAQVPSFLRCDLFEEQLKLLQPDLVILGLGINDAYGKRFSQRDYEANYDMLISRIRRAAPETAIIFTTNNDSYIYRRYVNKNGEKVKESMLKMAEEHNTGVWNMYDVMGGLNSIVLWERNHLAQHDKIHFTREGYLIMGDLFFNALMKNFEQYLQSKNQLTINNSEENWNGKVIKASTVSPSASTK